MEKLQHDFQEIARFQGEIIQKRALISQKLEDFKGIYMNLVKQNSKKIFLFCLDSFYFQYKTLTIEMENLSKYVALINNRMYGDYYKLFHIIQTQMGEQNSAIRDLALGFRKYVVYKDLEPFHEYRVDHICGMHADILNAIHTLYAHFMEKEQKVVDYSMQTSVGMSVHSFLHTLEYENTLLREQISLYVSYIQFFHNSHLQFLKKLFYKMSEFQHEIEDDILLQTGQTSANHAIRKPTYTPDHLSDNRSNHSLPSKHSNLGNVQEISKGPLAISDASNDSSSVVSDISAEYSEMNVRGGVKSEQEEMANFNLGLDISSENVQEWTKDSPPTPPPQDPIYDSMQEPLGTSTPPSSQASVQEAPQDPVLEPVQDPPQEPLPEPVQEPSEEPPAPEPVQESPQESSEEPPAPEPVQEPSEDPPAPEPVQESSEEPVQDPPPEPVQESSEEPPASEPVQESSEEPVQDPPPEPVQESSEEPPASEPVQESSDPEPPQE